MDRMIITIGAILGTAFLAYCLLTVVFSETVALWIIRAFTGAGLLVAFVGGLAGAWFLWQRIRHRAAAEARRTDAAIREAYHRADILVHGDQTTGYIVHQNGTDRIEHFRPHRPLLHIGGGKFADPAGNRHQEPDTPPETLPPLLPILESMDRILIIGGQGSGKTSLLHWMVDAKLKDSHVMVLDSHASPFDWPPYAQVVGIGRDYPAIEAAVNSITAELDRRYKLRAAGVQLKFERMLLVADELFAMAAHVDIRPQVRTLLTEARKVDIGIILAGHSDRAANIGLEGSKDLLNGFQGIVYLELDDDGRHVGTIETSRGKKRYLHPGPYRSARGGNGPRQGAPGPSGPAPGWGINGGNGWGTNGPQYTPPTAECTPGTPQDTPHTPGTPPGKQGLIGRILGISMRGIQTDKHREREIIDLFRQGESVSGIRKQVYRSKGGNQLKIIRGVLEKYGLVQAR